MLFNSYAFVFLFLPITFVGFFLIARFSHFMAALWLAAASLFFYGWWDPRYVVLLVASIGLNYVMGYVIGKARSADGPTPRAKLLLILALAANLGILGYYKYTDFFINTVNDLSGAGWALHHVILPLGISFFTFTQIAFLVDVYRGIAREYNAVHYVLFASYFPHLIAGPVLHHKQMMPQFHRPETYRINVANFNDGMTIFVIGLFKKVLIADQFALYANPVFTAVEGGATLSMTEAWVGALAYTFQLYFDFSAYSDMAIGLSRMFNVDLPINFNSPYKSRSIIDFWRRWHITLSTFLRDYLYFGLGGNRHGAVRRYVNLLTTMVLGGLWHGANWTFV
ncbi:MAG: MBOAT family protein, partial [Burkholderiales bacterium]